MQSVNLALEAGRLLQRKQTGFVHYCAQSEDEKIHDTIPVLENGLFAFSLFRSRISENILEARSIVEKLLAFERGGNFPVYLHEFPHTFDRYLSLRLLPIFYWIGNDFGHVLGEVKGRLNECINRMLTYIEGLDDLPTWAQFRLEAFQGRLGPKPSTLHDWSEALISMQIAEKKGVEVKEMLSQACQLWHPLLQTYIGPSVRRHQRRGVADLSVFDLFMAQWSETLSSDPIRPIHLWAALVRPLLFEPLFSRDPTPLVHFNRLEECPLWIGWQRHTFVLSGKHIEVKGDSKTLILTCDKEEEIPVNFFLNHHRDHQILVNGQRATTFCAEDRLEILSNGIRITLSFSHEDGKYFGHILRGNRPSQHGCKGEDTFEAFDWRIAIRAVKAGSQPMRVSLQVAQQTPESQQTLPLHASHCLHIASPQ